LRNPDLLKISDAKFVVDSLYGIEIAEEVALQYGCNFEVLVEIDTGGNRCGATTPQDAVHLVQRILESRSLRFGGIQAYYGGTSYIKDRKERQQAVSDSDYALRDVLEAVQKVCTIPRVSGAGTGNAVFHMQNDLLTEIQAGSYVYSDTTYRELAPEYHPALFVLATTISRPVESRVILDVGLKGMGTEFSDPELVRYPHLKQYHFSEEHLQWQVEKEPSPRIGEKVLIIPSHCCSTVNLHRRCYVLMDNKIVDIWTIDAF
jgi:D-serine deaminase-like pyridoxal phosphate-dependent protein